MKIILVALFLSVSISQAESIQPILKQKLKCNMTIKYKTKPKKVNTFNEFLEEGIFYGRVRFNNFLFDAKTEKDEDHYIAGLGGSLIYKSAYFNGFSFTSGLYTSQNIGEMNTHITKNYKAGKDVLSRYAVSSKNDYGITTFAENYLEYKTRKNQLKIGDFKLETMLAKSNDTKMIPNTFEGIYFKSRSIPKTTIQTAYLSKQKLRDHSNFHHLFAYGDNPNDSYGKWKENDDGAMHKGITVSKLKERNIKDRLFIFEAKNNSIDNVTLKISYTTIPQLLSSVILESNYKIEVNDNFLIIPSLRYMQQFDNGAGEIAGANIKNDTTSYSNPETLNSSLIAGRIDFVNGDSSLRLGFSSVEDKGDILAPWRGLPTAGYSRAMGQTNWQANTKSYLIRADYDFSKIDTLEGLRGMMRYAINDFDDQKTGVQADSHVLTFDLVKDVQSIPNLSTKLRTAFVNGENNIISKNNTTKKDPSYNEIRLEMNYLF